MRNDGLKAGVLLESILFGAFLISGACGLVYEVLWGKYLSLFIGSTTYGHMMVLAAFMAGLSGGSYYFGRRVDAMDRPLKLYGWVEVGIGLYGVLYPTLLNQAKELYFQIMASQPVGGGLTLLCKLALSLAVVILPTFLMGGTVPILGKILIRSLGRVGRRMALLYFVNGFGAVFGALLAGFYLIELFGLQLTMILTGLVNVLVGLFVLTAEWLTRRKGTPVPEDIALEAPEAIVTYSPGRVWLACAAIFLSGLTSMVYELVWTRLFAVVLGSSTYSFSLMLAAFIAGLSLGSLLASRLAVRTKCFLYAFGLAELTIALAVLGGLPFYERLPYYFWKLRYLLRPVPDTLVYYHAIKLTLCFMIMLLPTLFFGLTLPLASKIAGTDLGRLGRRLGTVYSANTLGTLLGALLAGLALIPGLGLQRSLEVAAVINAILGVALIAGSGEVSGRITRWAPAALCAVVSGLYFLWAPTWNPLTYSWGPFRSRQAPPATYGDFLKSFKGSIRYYKEDFNCHIAVLETRSADGQSNLSLTVNGKPDASSTYDMPTQILLGQLPMVFHPQAQDILIVGMGSGVTAGTVLTHPVRQVEAVEISPAVAEAVRLFKPYNNDVLNNPRFRLVIEDAKTFIRMTPQAYDVVINEPSNPWVAGVGNLFSVEFFEDVSRRLKPGGLMVQWFHNYEMTSDITAMVVKTMHAVFPNIYVFQGSSKDIILMGARSPVTPDFSAMTAKLATPAVCAELGKINVVDLPSLLALQMLSPSRIAELTMESEVNRDDRPLLEYRAPRAFYLGENSNLVSRSDLRFSARNDLFLSQYMKDHPLTAETYRNLLRLFREDRTRNDRLAYSICERLAQEDPSDPEVRLTLANLSASRGRPERALALLQSAMSETGSTVPLMEQYADLTFSRQLPLDSVFNKQNLDETVRYLQRCLKVSGEKDRYLIKLAQTYQAMELYREALSLLLTAEQTRHSSPAPARSGYSDETLYQIIGRTYYQLSEYAHARDYFQRCLRINPANTEAAYFMLVIRDAMQSAGPRQAAWQAGR